MVFRPNGVGRWGRRKLAVTKNTHLILVFDSGAYFMWQEDLGVFAMLSEVRFEVTGRGTPPRVRRDID